MVELRKRITPPTCARSEPQRKDLISLTDLVTELVEFLALKNVYLIEFYTKSSFLLTNYETKVK